MVCPKLSIELKPSLIAGVGVFAVKDFEPGDKVIIWSEEDDGSELISWSEFVKYEPKIKEMVLAFCLGTPKGFFPVEGMDFNHLSISWFVNHSCDANLGFDENDNLIAIKKIKASEELSYDYGLAESNPDFSMACVCGSVNCRKIITGQDWQSGLVDPRFMLSYLKKQLKI